MNKLDDIRIKQSECRERGRALLALETRTAEQETELRELTPKAQALEVEYRAAVITEPEPDEGRPVAGDAETREREDLARGACVGARRSRRSASPSRWWRAARPTIRW